MRDRERIAATVRAAQGGDERAFAALVASFQDIAVAYAMSILRDYHHAEDAAQEAFVDAYRALPSLREPEAFPSWFRRIVYKHCDRITRRKSEHLVDLTAALDVASPGRSAQETLEWRETRRALRAAIATLTEAEQQVVLLFYMGGHSQTAIADFLDVTPNTVKTRLYSARRRLRAHMSDLEQHLDAVRPSSDPRFADAVRRLIQPDALKQRHPSLWSPGIGTDVWEMFVACTTGDLATVQRLVERDPSLVRSHYEYRTPLSFAVRENQLAIAEFLLDRGAMSVGLGDPLEMARDRGYIEMERLLERKLAELHDASAKGDAVAAAIRDYDPARVRELIDASPELVDAGDHTSNRPIHWATMTRQLDVIDALVDRGADIDARRFDGARAIHLTNGDYTYRGWRDVPAHAGTTPDDVYRHLVARGATVDVWMAAAKGDLRRVRELIDADPSLANRVNDYNSYYVGCGSALKNAAGAGHAEIVALLLDRGADPNLPEEGIAPRGHALYFAVFNGHYEIAKLLLERGANPDAPVESSADAVWIAIRSGDRRMIELLASHGATWEIPIRPDGALTYDDIVATGLRRSVEILGYFGDVSTAAPLFASDPSSADDPDALRAAAINGHEAFVRLLLHHQPDLAARVTVSRPREMAELLFARGMDPDRPNWMRITPLHEFARQGDIESAAVYLDHGADIEAEDAEMRSTPLGWAAERGRTQMVEFLLRRGARADPANVPPWAKPLGWAVRRGHDDVMALLTAYERTATLPVRTLERYDALANDLTRALAGDEAALRQIMEWFQLQRPLTWDRPPIAEQVARLRRAVGERLGGAVQPAADGMLDIADARLLIARSEGFASWAELAASPHLTSSP